MSIPCSFLSWYKTDFIKGLDTSDVSMVIKIKVTEWNHDIDHVHVLYLTFLIRLPSYAN